MREKKRYLHYEVTTDGSLSTEEVKQAVQESMQQFLGEYGCAQAGVHYMENTNRYGVIKTNTKYVNQVKTALALIKTIKNKNVRFTTTKVSGMINKVKRRN
ncbi:MAG TPA: Rpp14/Pop5 family protein [Candidatus Nanoarchaeia archaeon]|nr:Rpp14/Pop5 family protein [Candidatus Nanoarchaeia archaeon]HLD39464.1 Rpp14/Pop5 family protein [archaeon]